jgi:hypothetical protein
VSATAPAAVSVSGINMAPITTNYTANHWPARTRWSAKAVGAVAVTLCLVVAGKPVVAHLLVDSQVVATPRVYTVDPRSESPDPVEGLRLRAGDILQVLQRSGYWVCDPNHGPAYRSGIGGADVPGDDNTGYLIPDAPLCSLVVKVGNGGWMRLSDTSQVTLTTSGPLYLTANDTISSACNVSHTNGHGCYGDNVGFVTVEIIVRRGSSGAS